MAYQVAKEIGAAGAVLQGKVDAILLTGGFAYDSMLMGWIKEYISYQMCIRDSPYTARFRRSRHGPG